MEVDDDEIEELEEEVSSSEIKDKTKIKQNIIKTNINSNNLNNDNSKEIKIDKLKSKVDNRNNNNKTELKNSKKEMENKKSTNSNINVKNNSINNKKINQNNNINSKSKQSQTKKNTNSNINSRKPKEKKEPEKDIQEFKEIHKSVQKFKKSEIYKKLNEEEKNKIIEFINGVEEFDVENPDLEGINGFPYINEFKKEEKSLSEVIPDLNKNIIKKYNKEQLEDRVNKVLDGENLKENNEEVKLILEILEKPSEFHMDTIKSNFEKEKLKNFPKKDKDESFDIQQLEEKLFGKEEFLPEFNTPFSKLENLQTFIYKYSVHENPNLLVKALKNFDYWRMTLSDGNSFYRVNIFAIIEHCIFKGDSELLSIILNEMSSEQFTEIYKLKKIEYEKPFEILSAILMLIENNMEEKAYEFFLKAYNMKNNNFDLLLIVYLKRVIYNFGEQFNKLLDDKKEDNVDEDLIENIKLNLDEIDSLYLEPKLNIIYLISYLFDVNIKLFIVNGDFMNPKCDVKGISDEEQKDCPLFIFGYFFSSYHILYLPSLQNNVFQNVLENDNPKITQLTFHQKEKKKCKMCSKDTKHIVFLRKKFIVCQPCLINYIRNIVIKERKTKFIEGKCFGLEYYCRQIHLQDEFYLDDYEFIEIIQDKNIKNELCSIVKCNNCDKVKNNKDEEFIKLKCGCIYCCDCMEETILQLTGNLGLLLECEYEKYKKNKFECFCKKSYSYKDLKEFVENDEEQIEGAKKRMNDYIKKDCMICLKSLISDEKVKKIKMRKDSLIPDHFICIPCYKRYFKKVKITETEEEDGEEENEDETREMAKEKENEDDKPKKKQKKIVKLEEQKIYCNICSTWHNYKDEVESCGCFIY